MSQNHRTFSRGLLSVTSALIYRGLGRLAANLEILGLRLAPFSSRTVSSGTRGRTGSSWSSRTSMNEGTGLLRMRTR